MNYKLFASIALAALTLAGCKTPTEVDQGPIQAATFSFFRAGPLPEAAFAENRQQIHRMVQEAISKQLTAQGLYPVAQGGDVTVAYLIIAGNNATTTSINDYFGHTDDAIALADRAHKAYADTEHRNYFEAGTLIIDLVDSRTHKLLLRNTVTRSVLRHPPLDIRQANIQAAVDAALNKVRVIR